MTRLKTAARETTPYPPTTQLHCSYVSNLGSCENKEQIDLDLIKKKTRVPQLRLVCTKPEKFEKGVFTTKTYQMFAVYTTPKTELFENAL